MHGGLLVAVRRDGSFSKDQAGTSSPFSLDHLPAPLIWEEFNRNMLPEGVPPALPITVNILFVTV
jgi:hypothetical protein